MNRPKSLGEALRFERTEKRWTINQAATRLGWTAQFLSDCEHGREHLTRRKIDHVTLTYDLPPYRLLMYESLQPSAPTDDFRDMVKRIRFDIK